MTPVENSLKIQLVIRMDHNFQDWVDELQDKKTGDNMSSLLPSMCFQALTQVSLNNLNRVKIKNNDIRSIK